MARSVIRWLRCKLGFHCSCSVEFSDWVYRWVVICDRCGQEVRLLD